MVHWFCTVELFPFDGIGTGHSRLIPLVIALVIPLQNECFSGVGGLLYWNLSVSVSMCPSVYKILLSVKALAEVSSHSQRRP